MPAAHSRRRTPAETLAYLRYWAELLDNRFTIPGTRIRFGLDPILSLIPGAGDLASPAFAVLLVAQGVRQRVPKVVLARMLVNALVDALVGAVPVVGNVADIFWRANARNLALLERHAQPGAAPSPSDYAVVGVLVMLFGVLVLVPAIVAVWLAVLVWRAAGG